MRAAPWIVAATAAVVVIGLLAVVLPRGYEYDAGIDGFRRTGDPKTILVDTVIGGGDVIVGYAARETPSSVLLAVRARNTNSGWSDLVGHWMPVVVSLREPLGERTVIDARSGYRLRDASAPVPPAGVIEKGSFRTVAGAIDFKWNDPTGVHALSDLRGSTVVLLTRDNRSNEAKMNLLALESHFYDASAEERARTQVIVITFGRFLWDVAAPIDQPFRGLLAEDDVNADMPEILQPSATPAMWFVGPDGVVRERIVGKAASTEEILRALAAAR